MSRSKNARVQLRAREEVNELWANRGRVHPALRLDAPLGLYPLHTEASVIQKLADFTVPIVPPSALLISGCL